jgi:iron complex outermembrane receptor protein
MQINPGITGGVEFLGKKISAAVWAGRVQRSGDLTERYMNSFPVGLDPYELLGNPGLSPEINNQADLVFEFSPTRDLTLEIDLFFSYLQHYISSEIREDLVPKMPSAPGVRQFTNLDKASMAGFEIMLRQKLPASLMFSTDIAATIGTDLSTGEPLPEIPPLDVRVALKGSYMQEKLHPGIRFRYVAVQSRISEVFGETETPSFWLMDLDISYLIRDRVLVSTGVKNLFDMAYYEHLNRSVRGSGTPIYDPGRNLFLGLTIQF